MRNKQRETRLQKKKRLSPRYEANYVESKKRLASRRIPPISPTTTPPIYLHSFVDASLPIKRIGLPITRRDHASSGRRFDYSS